MEVLLLDRVSLIREVIARRGLLFSQELLIGSGWVPGSRIVPVHVTACQHLESLISMLNVYSLILNTDRQSIGGRLAGGSTRHHTDTELSDLFTIITLVIIVSCLSITDGPLSIDEIAYLYGTTLQ